MIELIDFSKTYSSFFTKKNAVENISFTVKPNSITGLLGPNGAGKTTIIKAVCAMHYPTSGNVYVYDKNGKKIDTMENPESAKKIIGYVSEIPNLKKNFTVIEYLKMICDIWDIDDKKNLDKIISDFKLEKVLAQKISTLSKGFCQRVSFASALVHNPQILILDEPSSGLDPNQIIETRNIIKKLSCDKTVLLSTHIMQEAENLCDNAVIISHGKLIASGSVSEILKNTSSKNLEESYIKLTKGQKDEI